MLEGLALYCALYLSPSPLQPICRRHISHDKDSRHVGIGVAGAGGESGLGCMTVQYGAESGPNDGRACQEHWLRMWSHVESLLGSEVAFRCVSDARAARWGEKCFGGRSLGQVEYITRESPLVTQHLALQGPGVSLGASRE